MKYFTLQVEFSPGVWSPDFGDYERKTVMEEIWDRVDGYEEDDSGNELKRDNYRIVVDEGPMTSA